MSDSPAGLRDFFSELRRRRVFRVALVYAGVGFVLLQAADLLFPALVLPDWSFRLLVAFLILGFPIALVLAWAFEITPEGVRRTESLTAEASVPGEAEHGMRARPIPYLGLIAVLGIGG